jgi:methylglyoxal synthase
LTAHDQKKELMVQFCIAYCGILSKHSLCATSTTGHLIIEATGLPVTLYLPGVQGGTQQIGARVAYNELDLVLFFSDPSSSGEDIKSVTEIARMCDTNNIPFASNAATAEVLIHGLQRGDLEWRDIVNPKK